MVKKLPLSLQLQLLLLLRTTQNTNTGTKPLPSPVVRCLTIPRRQPQGTPFLALELYRMWKRLWLI